MEAIRKQASKLREQVARQQQAVLRQFGGGGYGGSDTVITDEEELQRHQKLEKLYISTRSAKHFQRDIVRGVEGAIVTGSKQVEIGTKLCEDSRRYGSGNTCTNGNTLTRASLSFANARALMEKERETLLKALGTQVAEPLRAMVMGAPLVDARHLAQRYERMRQEAESQTTEVSKRRAKVRENPGNPELVMKLEYAEAKLQDLKSNMTILGKEAASAMAAVEEQQQNQTLQRLITLVEAERSYHQRILEIIEHLEGEMRFEQQRIEAPQTPQVENITSAPQTPQAENITSAPQTPQVENITASPPPYEEAINGVNHASQMHDGTSDAMGYFLGEVMFPYQSDSEFELNLSVGDYVVIREVTSSGWAEGECKGKAGWFPYDYIERRDRVLATKVIEVF